MFFRMESYTHEIFNVRPNNLFLIFRYHILQYRFVLAFLFLLFLLLLLKRKPLLLVFLFDE